MNKIDHNSRNQNRKNQKMDYPFIPEHCESFCVKERKQFCLRVG